MATARFALLAVAIYLFSNSIAFALPSSRIWGGEDGNSGDTPWIVSVRVDTTHKCVGNIISMKHVVTSAQGVSDLPRQAVAFSRVSVRVGSINQFAGGDLVNCESIAVHPNSGNFINDIAILTLARTLTWGPKIAAIPLPTAADEVAEGETVTLDGWGLQEGNQSPYKLQHLSATVLGRAECEYQAGYGYESVICLSSPERKGICTGDSGAGVVSNNKLVGVASFAFGSCGTQYPDVSTKVVYFLDWINAIING